jgi:hypothetical protein
MADLRDLADDLILREGRGSTPFGLYVVPGLSPAAELGREIERAVFMEFFGNSRDLLAAEYEPYDRQSFFLLVLDHALREPAGTMRILLPHGPSKSLQDIHRAWHQDTQEVLARTNPDIDPSRLWDIATLAVMPGYRRSSTSGLISLSLYQALGALTVHHEVDWLVAILDVVVLDLIQTLIDRPFAPFAGLEPQNYLDSPSSLPVFIDLQDYKARISFTDPDKYAMLFEGVGLEAAVSAPTWREAALEGGLAEAV